jgi:tetratricopeptide (TPR) repeat protein
VGQGRRIDRSLWPDQGPYRQFLVFLDRVHAENGVKSLRAIASRMSVDSPTRISALLRGVSGTLPADVGQLEELVRGLGGGDDEVSRSKVLYQRAVQARSEGDRNKVRRLNRTGFTASVPMQLPGRIPGFVGRRAELQILDDLAEQARDSTSTVVISAVDGTAGIGKTALARHWAQQAAAHFPDGQLYIDLRGFDVGGLAMTSAEAVRAFLEAFEVPSDRIPVGEAAQGGLLRSILSSRRVLLLLDNARDSNQVRPLIPGSPGCMVVVTSRNRLGTLISGEGARPLTLGLLSVDESRELIEGRVGAQKVAAELQVTQEIISLCARLPLALSIVATRVATHPSFPLASVATELRLARNSEAGSLAVFNGGEASADLAAVFAWSYKQLSPEAAGIFRLLGLHPGPDISVAAAASLTGGLLEETQGSLRELAGAHLIEEHVPGRFSSHDLLRAYAIELARAHDHEVSRRAAISRLLDHYAHSAYNAALRLYPMANPITLSAPTPGTRPEAFEDYTAAWAWFEAERAVLVSTVKTAAGIPGPNGWQLPWALQDYFRRRGHWDDWAATEQAALEAADRDEDIYGQAQAHHGLGRALTWLTDYQQSAHHLQTAVRMFEEAGDLTAEANAYLDLAQMYSQAGQPDDALPPAREGLRLAEEVNDPAIKAKALNNTGWYYAQLGEPAQALSHCMQALSLFRETGNRRGQSNTLDSIGYAFHLLHSYAEAIDYYGQSLVLREELGDRHGHAATLTHLGDTQHAMSNISAARQAWSEALEILDELGHPDSEEVRAKLNGIELEE